MNTLKLLAAFLFLFLFGSSSPFPPQGRSPNDCSSLEDVQAALDRYLRGDPAELARRAGAGRVNYARRYISCLNEIIRGLPPGSDPYNQAFAQRSYFSALDYRIRAEEIRNTDLVSGDSLLYLGLRTLKGLTDPADITYIQNELGIIYERLDSLEQAHKQYQGTIKIDSTFGLAYVNLANVLLAMDAKANRTDAMQLYRTAIRKNQNKLATAYLGLGNLLVDSESTRASGLSHLDTAYDLLSSIPEVQYGYGRGLAFKEDRQAAKRMFNEVKANPSTRMQGYANYALGQSYLNSNRKSKARTQYRNAVGWLANDSSLQNTAFLQLGQAYRRSKNPWIRYRGRQYFRSKMSEGRGRYGVYAAFGLLNGKDWETKFRVQAERRGPRFIQQVATGLFQSNQPVRAEKVAAIGVDLYGNSAMMYRTYVAILVTRGKLESACSAVASAQINIPRPSRFNLLLCFIENNPGGKPDFYDDLRNDPCWRTDWTSQDCPPTYTDE